MPVQLGTFVPFSRSNTSHLDDVTTQQYGSTVPTTTRHENNIYQHMEDEKDFPIHGSTNQYQTNNVDHLKSTSSSSGIGDDISVTNANNEVVDMVSSGFTMDECDPTTMERFSWHHFKICLIAGVGFCSDSYDIFTIGLCLPMLYRVYYPPPGNSPFESSSFSHNHPHIDALMKASTSWGNLAGQLLFGYLGDKLGRQRIYGVEMFIMMIAILGSVFAANTVHGGMNVLFMMGFWRFILGMGIGGDYPLSASIASEFSRPSFRGRMVSGIFSMQGIGILLGGLLTLITLAACHSWIEKDPLYLDMVWRMILGFGLIPCFATIGARLNMPESPVYQAAVVQTQDASTSTVDGDDLEGPQTLPLPSQQLDQDIEQDISNNTNNNIANSSPVLPSFQQYFSEWRNFKILFSTCFCWFALDTGWYGLTLNNQLVLELIGYAATTTDPAHPVSQYHQFWEKAVGNMIVACLGIVPGYYVAIAFIDKMGRIPMQKLGFAVIATCLFILSFGWSVIKKHSRVFLFIFTIAQFFFNFGPNVTTYVIPSEVFPTHLRARAHGISAAVGKLGAIIGIQLIAPFLYGDNGMQVVMFIFGVMMVLGFIATMWLPDMTGKDLLIWDQFNPQGIRLQVDPDIA